MLRNRSLIGLVAAELVSLTGTSMTFVALPWFVYVTTGSVAKMGWVLAAEMAPIGLLGIPAGSLVQRLGPKRTMLVCDAARGPLLAILPLLYWTDRLSFTALLAVTFAVGCFAAPYYASSRLIIPDVVGEDERLVAQVNGMLGGATMLTQVLGPVAAGVLIAATSPAAVLVVDACTYVFSFVTIGVAVRAGRRVAGTAESKGLLAGLRFLWRDSLLGPLLVAACGINLVAQGLIVSLQVLVVRNYNESAHVLGWIFAGFGVGAVIGSIAVSKLVQKVDLLKLAAVAIVIAPLPLFLLAIELPWGAAVVVVATFAFFTPLINAPIIGVITVRTPQALRPKVMTAVMTVATVAGPIGFIVAGIALQHVSLAVVFVAVAAGMLLGGIAFAAVLLRAGSTEGAAAGSVTMPDIAHG
jgi:MFS family permease